MKRLWVSLFVVVASFSQAVALPRLGIPDVQGPDVPTVTRPAAVVHAFDRAEFSCAQQGTRTATIEIPNVTYNRVILVVTIEPDGDPWDRLFGVAINGVEVMRGTTPRTAFTLRKDVTEFAGLLPPGGTAEVALTSGSFVGRLLESVRLDFYAKEPTAALVRAPAERVVGGFLWRSLAGDGTTASSTVAFPNTGPASAVVELTISGHGESGEFWYLDDPIPRVFQIVVDGKKIAVARSMPYIYALVGFGNDNANTACAGPGTSADGDLLHPVMWWTAQRVADVLGVHSGVGEIPPYRAVISGSDLALLRGTRTVSVRQIGGGSLPQNWPTSLSFLLK